jgi:uncharacterized protein
MKLPLDEITEESRECKFSITSERIAELLETKIPSEYRSPAGMKSSVTVYRATEDIFLSGNIEGEVVADCARCLVSVPISASFDFQTVLLPEPVAEEKGSDLGADDLALGHYGGEELDFEPLCVEQLILQLPSRLLCKDDCRGLCINCGSNLNTETCRCTAEPADPRFAVLKDFRVKSGNATAAEPEPDKEK